MLFESHAHYDDERFDADRDELLSKLLPEAGVTKIVNAGADLESSRAGAALAARYDYIYSAAGVHPHYVKDMRENDIDALRKLAAEKKTVAIGETGLDFYYNLSPRDEQERWFKGQLSLAHELLLPVIVHSRDADAETFEILREWAFGAKNTEKIGVIHCFSSGGDLARRYVDMGFYIAFGGIVTFDKTGKTQEAVESVPLDKILIETDSPYLSPAPVRGKRNDSRNLKYIVEKIAQIKKISREYAEDVTYENALSIFSIK